MPDAPEPCDEREAQKRRAERLRAQIRNVTDGTVEPQKPRSPRDFIEDHTPRAPKSSPPTGAGGKTDRPKTSS